MANTFTDLHVSSGSNANINVNSFPDHTTFVPSGANANANAAGVVVDLLNIDVTLTTVGSPNNGQAGDISTQDDVNWSAHTLTLDAAGSISVGARLGGSGSAGLVLEANGGTITQTARIEAPALTGSSLGATNLGLSSNIVGTLGDFSTGSSSFTLNGRGSLLQIAGAVTAGVFDLSQQAGADESGSGHIVASRLQSSSGVGNEVSFNSSSNNIAALGHFAVTGAGGDFSLTDNTATLTIDGPVSATDDVTIANVRAGGVIAHAPDTEKQHLVITGSSGTFTLTYNGQTTAALAFNATATDVAQALANLSSISTVSGGGFQYSQVNGGPIDITFTGTLGNGVASLLTAAASGGATATVTPTGPSPISGHDVTLTADQIALDSNTTVTATDKITLAPETAGAAVGLGTSLAPSPFFLDNFELATLSAPVLTVGSATAGPITISSATVSSATLNLVSGAGVSAQIFSPLRVGGGTGTVNVTAGGTVNFLFAADFGAIGGTTTSGDFIVIRSSRVAPLATNAIGTAGGEIVLVNQDGDLNINGAVRSAGGNILAGSSNNNAQVLNINDTIDAGAGAIGLFGAAGITQSNGHLAGVNLIAIVQSGLPGEAISLTDVANAVSGNVDIAAGPNGDVSFTNLSGYTIGGLASISYPSSRTVIQASGGAGIRTSATASATLTMGGDVTEASGAGDIVSTGTLNLLRLPGANPTVTLNNPNNAIGDLHTVDLGSGVLSLTDSVAVTVDGAVSAFAVQLTTAGSFTLAATGSVTTTAGMVLNIGTDGTLAGSISGNGSLTIYAGGIVTLTATDSYHGLTTVQTGTLLVDGSIATSVETDVRSGATLGGHGTVGAVHVFGAGTLSPGDSPGVLTTGAVTLDSGAHFVEQIGGTATGSYDQLQVHGSVNLGGATLDLSLVNGFTPTGGVFTLIDNDGSDAVTGTFAGLAEGAQVNLGGINFVLSYHGGDGNDVTLTALGGVPNDFNADKVGDVLWQNTNGSVSEWLVHAGAIAANLGVGSGSGLHFLDTGDFNADGHSDVLWRDDSGNVTLWTLDGAQILAKQNVGSIDASWQDQGAADFNGDGHADALWRNGGQVALWTMNGSQITANQSVTTNLGADWHIQGLGDFNGDHNSDVLLRSSSSGQVVLWTMNGAQVTANQSVTNLGLDWHVQGAGDFSGDGKSDILVRNDSGQVVLLTMNGNQITANQNVANIDASWHVQGTSDYTGDGHADVLWRNDSGQLALWEMNGNHLVSNHTVGYANGQAATIDQSWSVLHHAFDLV